jgi:hypothetical protein
VCVVQCPREGVTGGPVCCLAGSVACL